MAHRHRGDAALRDIRQQVGAAQRAGPAGGAGRTAVCLHRDRRGHHGVLLSNR